MDDVSPKSLELLIKTGIVPFSQILELLVAIDNVYVSLGGSGLHFTSTDMVVEEVLKSSYELHADTPFVNTTKKITESRFPRYVPREQVYDAIDKHIRPELVTAAKEDIQNRFPQEQFDSVFPYCSVLDILFNTYARYNGDVTN